MPSSMIRFSMFTICAWRICAAIHDVGHLHAAPELVALRHYGKDAHLAGLHVVEHYLRHIGQRAVRNLSSTKAA
ncbi:MAG: hypothetical protein QM757_46665 [Paludibaculum sp.]